ncbi:MAG: biopolymer transporter ExbD [Bdellovibrionota bacterium]|nr:biopolymer transporter ExbD [Pseudobdellovibrionaceae bacterium]|tara:strand:- start:60617 stop:61018 length:402 start_codon:yes stop_codon:yes gene_type:complete
MGASFNKDDEAIADINITPFVDIILVVLIIFMVTTPIIMNPGIKIQLPKAASGEETKQTKLNVSIAKDGKILLNGAVENDNSLAQKVKDLVAKNKEIQAIIAADKDVAHGTVIRVIDIVKSNGVSKFAISTEK